MTQPDVTTDTDPRPPIVTVTVDELAHAIHGPKERDWFSCMYADEMNFDACPSKELHRDFAHSLFDKLDHPMTTPRDPEAPAPVDVWAQRWADFVSVVENSGLSQTERHHLIDTAHAAAEACNALGLAAARDETDPRPATPRTPPLDVSELFGHAAGALCGHVHPSYGHEAWQRMVDAIAQAHGRKHAKPGNGPGGVNEYRKALRWALDYIDAFATPHGSQYLHDEYRQAAELVGDEQRIERIEATR